MNVFKAYLEGIKIFNACHAELAEAALSLPSTVR
jgi:exonuclease VII small subunit